MFIYILMLIVSGYLFPYVLYKKNPDLYSPYVLIGFSLLMTICVVLVIVSQNNEWWSIFLASLTVYGVLIFGFLFYTLGLWDSLVYRIEDLVSKRKRKPESYLKNYYHRTVFEKASSIETDYWGFLRFRMNEISYYQDDSSHPSVESVICKYHKPLAEEGELITLSNEFSKYYGPYAMKSDEWRLANTIWHDEKGAYRLMLIFIFDDNYNPPTNEYAKFVDYSYVRAKKLAYDTDNENDHGFRRVVAVGGRRMIDQDQ